MKIRNKKNGFTLIETLVSVSIFIILAISFAGIYKRIFVLSEATRYKNIGVFIANSEMEIIRNLPYDDIGIVNSIPSGVLLDQKNVDYNGVDFKIIPTVRNIDDPADGIIGGIPNDLSPADSKFIELEVFCDECLNYQPIVVSTRISPKNLETASSNGALKIQVFDANGQPLQGASITITNDSIFPNLIITDISDINGELLIVDVPPGINDYEVSVTKEGYSTDRTYLPGDIFENPSVPDLTVALQQVTQSSFSIDQLSNLQIRTVSPSCSLFSNVSFDLIGSKVIANDPVVYKYQQSKNSGSGSLDISDLEWDTYNVLLTSDYYELIGLSTLNPIEVNPNANQSIDLVLQQKNPKSLLVTVLDIGSGLPITNANVSLYKNGSLVDTEITGQGSIRQTDWSGGQGQDDFVDETMFYSGSGVSVFDTSGQILLDDFLGNFVSDGYLESSSIDLLSINNLGEIFWTPEDQSVLAGENSVLFQIATNNDNLTWNFVGPDGTSSSYYNIPGQPIYSGHNGDRYLRYKVFLHTEDVSVSPNISDIYFTYTGGCAPPGQVHFSGLSLDTYDLVVSKADYLDYEQEVPTSNDWQEYIAELTP